MLFVLLCVCFCCAFFLRIFEKGLFVESTCAREIIENKLRIRYEIPKLNFFGLFFLRFSQRGGTTNFQKIHHKKQRSRHESIQLGRPYVVRVKYLQPIFTCTTHTINVNEATREQHPVLDNDHYKNNPDLNTSNYL